jgi:hypothetical protein
MLLIPIHEATSEEKVMAGPINRIPVLLPRELGETIIEWALDPKKRPADLAAFVKDLVTNRGVLGPLPTYITSLKFVQAGKETLLIRLPPAELVQDTLTNIPQGGDYPLPPFYKQRLIDGQITDNRDFFAHRIGDYTVAHCT